MTRRQSRQPKRGPRSGLNCYTTMDLLHNGFSPGQRFHAGLKDDGPASRSIYVSQAGTVDCVSRCHSRCAAVCILCHDPSWETRAQDRKALFLNLFPPLPDVTPDLSPRLARFVPIFVLWASSKYARWSLVTLSSPDPFLPPQVAHFRCLLLCFFLSFIYIHFSPWSCSLAPQPSPQR